MLRSLCSALLTASAFCVVGSTVHATYVTTNGDFALPSSSAGGAGPFLNGLQISTGGSFAYTNIVGTPGVGSTINTVTFDVMSELSDDVTSPVYSPSSTAADPRRIIVASALTGTIVGFDAGSGGAIVGYSAGEALVTGQFVVSDAGTFLTGNPSSFDDTTIFATLSLAPRMAIEASPIGNSFPLGDGITADGAGGQVSAAFGEVNFSTPNSVDPSLSDTLLVFTDNGSHDLLFNVDPDGVEAPFGIGGSGFEGIYVDADQTILVGETGSLDAVDLAALNGVFATAGLGVFAAADGYTPGITGAGDFIATFQSQQYVITSGVPEPTSLAIFAIGCIGFGFVGVRRRRKNAAE